MKYITKGPEPEEFTDWKALANDNWQPTYDTLMGDEKTAVKKALMEDQGCICCYCERGLHTADSHIEHFRPQSDEHCDPLDFSNMLCSCQQELHEGDPRHCGNLKGDWFSAELLISPLDPICEQCFIFTEDGHIHPAENRKEAAQETISRLGLDIPKLVALREAAIGLFQDDNLTPDDIQEFAIKYLERTPQGSFNEFWTTIKYLFARELAV